MAFSPRPSYDPQEGLHEVDEVAAAVAYLYEEPSSGGPEVIDIDPETIFVFQYWPDQITDSYSPNYANDTAPGASHPIYQYVSGNERNINFSAVFTSEVNEPNNPDRAMSLPSSKYTVDVAAALARLEQYKYPTYRRGGLLGVVQAPPKLILVFPNLNLGRDSDEVRVILRETNPEITHFFPDGRPRIAKVNLAFSEIVQESNSDQRSRLQYVGRQKYSTVAKRYRRTLPNIGFEF